jgi:hypothetical protein
MTSPGVTPLKSPARHPETPDREPCDLSSLDPSTPDICVWGTAQVLRHTSACKLMLTALAPSADFLLAPSTYSSRCSASQQRPKAQICAATQRVPPLGGTLSYALAHSSSPLKTLPCQVLFHSAFESSRAPPEACSLVPDRFTRSHRCLPHLF